MMIDGNSDENSEIVHHKKKINHEKLRNAFQASESLDVDKKLAEYEAKIKQKKLERGDQLIHKLK